MNTNELTERAEKARQNIEAARDLLPSLVRDNSKVAAEIRDHIKVSVQASSLDRLHRVFCWLEQLGEANDCSPLFWQAMARAAAQLEEEINQFVTGQLLYANHQLKRIETDLENEDENVVEWAKKSDDNIRNTRNHFLKMAAHGTWSPMELLRHAKKYGRMTTEQEQTYIDLLRRFKAAMPKVKHIDLNLPSTILDEMETYNHE